MTIDMHTPPNVTADFSLNQEWERERSYEAPLSINTGRDHHKYSLHLN